MELEELSEIETQSFVLLCKECLKQGKQGEYNIPLFELNKFNKIEYKCVKRHEIGKEDINYQPIKKYSPFVGLGLTTQPTVAGQAGMFFEDKYGFSGLYQYDWTNNNHIFGAMFLMKF